MNVFTNSPASTTNTSGSAEKENAEEEVEFNDLILADDAGLSSCCLFCFRGDELEWISFPVEDENKPDGGRMGVGKLCNVVGRQYKVHLVCLMLSGGLLNRGKVEEGEEGCFGFLADDIEKKYCQSRKFKCIHCGSGCATIQCSKTGCTARFHAPCGFEKGSMHLFRGDFRSLCYKHTVNLYVEDWYQKYDEEHVPIVPPLLMVLGRDSGVRFLEPCLLCGMFLRTPDPEIDKKRTRTIMTDCCEGDWNDRYYHYECIQPYALRAGNRHLRCPECGSRKNFVNGLLKGGIFVPERSLEWHLVQCSLCGSAPRHIKCGGLSRVDYASDAKVSYYCQMCKDADAKYQKETGNSAFVPSSDDGDTSDDCKSSSEKPELVDQNTKAVSSQAALSSTRSQRTRGEKSSMLRFSNVTHGTGSGVGNASTSGTRTLVTPTGRGGTPRAKGSAPRSRETPSVTTRSATRSGNRPVVDEKNVTPRKSKSTLVSS